MVRRCPLHAFQMACADDTNRVTCADEPGSNAEVIGALCECPDCCADSQFCIAVALGVGGFAVGIGSPSSRLRRHLF